MSKKIKLSKEMFGDNAIVISAILNALIQKNKIKSKKQKKDNL
tara:strand:+ start:6195 stop:6323 length:129 start_codon:yes stop_codon:yes gene_type:complete